MVDSGSQSAFAKQAMAVEIIPEGDVAPPDPQFFLSDTATSWVVRELTIAEQELRVIDEEAFQLRAKLSQLDARRIVLNQKISRYRRAVSAVHLVPPEIWREIFLFCTPEPLGILPSTSEPRLIITQVCTLWRNIALSMPELWSNYEVKRTSIVFPHGVRARSLDVIETCFTRARSRPLLLTMEPPRDGCCYPLYIVPDILKPHAHKFYHLDLTLHPQEIRNWFKHLVTSRALPRARYFALRSTSALGFIGSGLHEDLSRVVIPLSTMAPLAQEIVLKLPTFNPHNLCLPSQHLTILELFELECSNGFTNYVHILRNCPILEELYITFSPTMEGRNPSSPPQPPLTLPKLHKIELRGSSLEVLLFFFLSIPLNPSFPSLKSLSLDSGYGDMDIINDLRSPILGGLEKHITGFYITDLSSLGGRFYRELGAEGLFPNMEVFHLDVHESIENNRPRRSMGLHGRYLTGLLQALEKRQGMVVEPTASPLGSTSSTAVKSSQSAYLAPIAESETEGEENEDEDEDEDEEEELLGDSLLSETQSQPEGSQLPVSADPGSLDEQQHNGNDSSRPGRAKKQAKRPLVKLRSVKIGYQPYHLTVEHLDMIERLRRGGLDLQVTDEKVSY